MATEEWHDLLLHLHTFSCYVDKVYNLQNAIENVNLCVVDFVCILPCQTKTVSDI